MPRQTKAQREREQRKEDRHYQTIYGLSENGGVFKCLMCQGKSQMGVITDKNKKPIAKLWYCPSCKHAVKLYRRSGRMLECKNFSTRWGARNTFEDMTPMSAEDQELWDSFNDDQEE